MQFTTDNIRIAGMQELMPANRLIEELPITEEASRVVFESRQEISDILSKKDDRLVVVVGPCSIHDPEAGIDYAEKLKGEIEKYKNCLLYTSPSPRDRTRSRMPSSA